MATQKLTSFRISNGHVVVMIDASMANLTITSERESGMGAIHLPADLLGEFIGALKEIYAERDPCPY